MTTPPIGLEKLVEHWERHYPGCLDHWCETFYQRPLHELIAREDKFALAKVSTIKQLESMFQNCYLHLKLKSSLIPLGHKFSGAAYIYLVMDLAQALGSTEAKAFRILGQLFEDTGAKPPISTENSYRVAKNKIYST
jgi:hypothetical protein